jgi:hypothetical protein
LQHLSCFINQACIFFVCLRHISFGVAGTGCTGASSALDITDEQWVTIRDKNNNKKNDKMKWKAKQPLIDASRAEGFSSGTRAELVPMSTAASVLHSFTTRNSNLLDEGEADAEVISPEKDLERAAKAWKLCARSSSHHTEEEAGSKVWPCVCFGVCKGTLKPEKGKHKRARKAGRACAPVCVVIFS